MNERNFLYGLILVLFILEIISALFMFSVIWRIHGIETIQEKTGQLIEILVDISKNQNEFNQGVVSKFQ